jgi:CheY-like chemotaxis protein
MVGNQQFPDSALRGSRVLIVEDEMLVAMELESLLRREGCAVVGPARTVGRALALLDQQRPDAVLLDFNLNGQAATPVAAALRKDGVPFVLVTGYGEAQMHEPELRHAPRVDKPVNERELINVLTRQLETNPHE